MARFSLTWFCPIRSDNFWGRSALSTRSSGFDSGSKGRGRPFGVSVVICSIITAQVSLRAFFAKQSPDKRQIRLAPDKLERGEIASVVAPKAPLSRHDMIRLN